MKYFMNKIAASFLWGTVMSASWVLAGCEASDFDLTMGGMLIGQILPP